MTKIMGLAVKRDRLNILNHFSTFVSIVISECVKIKDLSVGFMYSIQLRSSVYFKLLACMNIYCFLSVKGIYQSIYVLALKSVT